jgi:GTP-binding protein
VVNIRLPYEPLYGKLLGVALHSRIGEALTNMGASGADGVCNFVSPKIMTLGDMISYLTHDECIEVTPISLRMRKKILDSTARQLSERSQKAGMCFKILED